MIAVLLLAIVVCLVVGMPIAFALGAGSAIAILWDGNLPISIVAQRMFFGLDSWLLMAIPLFMLAGQLMSASGMSGRLVAFTTELFGFVRGSLGIVSVAASMRLCRGVRLVDGRYGRGGVDSAAADEGAWLRHALRDRAAGSSRFDRPGDSTQPADDLDRLHHQHVGVAALPRRHRARLAHRPGPDGRRLRACCPRGRGLPRDAHWRGLRPFAVDGTRRRRRRWGCRSSFWLALWAEFSRPLEAAVIAVVYGLVVGMFVYSRDRRPGPAAHHRAFPPSWRP